MLCFGRVCASPCALNVSAALQGAYTPGEIRQLASLGKNPSDTHIAANGTIMHFVGSNSQVYYNNLHQGWATIFCGGQSENFIATGSLMLHLMLQLQLTHIFIITL